MAMAMAIHIAKAPVIPQYQGLTFFLLIHNPQNYLIFLHCDIYRQPKQLLSI